jgi:hypothetical protein
MAGDSGPDDPASAVTADGNKHTRPLGLQKFMGTSSSKSE